MGYLLHETTVSILGEGTYRKGGPYDPETRNDWFNYTHPTPLTPGLNRAARRAEASRLRRKARQDAKRAVYMHLWNGVGPDAKIRLG